MKKNLTLLFFICLFSAFGQNKPKAPNGLKITYLKNSNGKPVENQDPILVFTNENETVVTSERISSGKGVFPFEQTLIIRPKNRLVQVANLSATKTTATTDSVSIAKQSFETTNDTKTILGYKCRKAKTVINSNTIELWYTDELKLKGAPSVLGQNLGLVLEMIRNGNSVVVASKIEKLKNINPSQLIPNTGNNVDALTYRDLLWKSRFTTISVFENEVINFSDGSKSNDSILRFANGTIILRKIKFPEIKSGSQVFVDLQEQSNGDAYDRTGSVFVIPTDEKTSFMDGLQNGAKTLPVYENGNGKKYQGVVRTDNYSPLLELMRFFTPFGIKQYNHIELKDKKWHEIVPYRQDISELYSALSNKELWVGTFIGNYDKGGHKISMHITIHNEEGQSVKNTFALPLFNTTNIMEMAEQEYATMFNHENGLEVTFTLNKDVKNAKLRYTTTGHGGWENGDEFVQKKNTILLDEKEAFAFIPWRQDCGSYRLFNPASGNFPNGLSSSDYSRSNWCPGMVTNPNLIELGDLKAGKHTIRIKIPQGAPEGSSFSAWNVSGVLIGN
ncbi:Peptide-N-glycosidase F like protein [Flavobacterium limnosediminis JC2902]|uniref:Peptide-N-glycosidase F like protein n=1 Tax=Flavobacterium limnosediminis JC2902 TaxID=1341181 RepID=V6SSZ4_9FLAO|nr:PNGase F N-terminal domain-containing protein [Flavobacterium limnosediminis]ESU29287.1 Peptide-N-glycosidase F like protein [Flavobacterium limnosediminis JC2902]